jgi:hypothetical protein
LKRQNGSFMGVVREQNQNFWSHCQMASRSNENNIRRFRPVRTVFVGLVLGVLIIGAWLEMTRPLSSRLRVGMSMDEVRRIAGEPDEIHRHGASEAWVYSSDKEHVSVGFFGGYVQGTSR